jgi:hypothetical protein
MVLRYVLDEQLRGPLWTAIQGHNAAGMNPLNVVRVGDPADLPLGTVDPDILVWAEREGRVLVTRDWSTMPTYLADHLRAGHHSPGIFMIRPTTTLPQVVASLELYAYAADPARLLDQIEVIP